jgi:hypothetical protein
VEVSCSDPVVERIILSVLVAVSIKFLHMLVERKSWINTSGGSDETTWAVGLVSSSSVCWVMSSRHVCTCARTSSAVRSLRQNSCECVPVTISLTRGRVWGWKASLLSSRIVRNVGFRDGERIERLCR